MKYTVSLLTTVADCQALIDLSNKEKDTMEFRKLGIVRQRQTATLTSAEIEATLIAVTAELESLQAIFPNLAEGPAKQEIFSKIKKDEYKKFLLEQRKDNYGVLALLQKEYDIASIDRTIAETDDFIAQVTARMNEI